MTQIADLVEVRSDGKLVPSTMTVREMLALGWGPSKVIALKWTFGGKEVEVQAPHGVGGIIVPGSNYVAALCSGDEANPRGRLTVRSPDGSILGELKNQIALSGHLFHGAYRWFEPAMTPQLNTFGVVFQTDEQIDLRCDVDASRLSVTNAIRVR